MHACDGFKGFRAEPHSVTTIPTVASGTRSLRRRPSLPLPILNRQSAPRSWSCSCTIVQSTEFDIVEQGTVPILMSLPQTRNRFQISLSPEQAWLSSSVLGVKNAKLRVAPSSHLVLDLLDLCRLMWNARFAPKGKVSFLTCFSHCEYGFHQTATGGFSSLCLQEALL